LKRKAPYTEFENRFIKLVEDIKENFDNDNIDLIHFKGDQYLFYKYNEGSYIQIITGSLIPQIFLGGDPSGAENDNINDLVRSELTHDIRGFMIYKYHEKSKIEKDIRLNKHI